jgi:hypothetical protein
VRQRVERQKGRPTAKGDHEAPTGTKDSEALAQGRIRMWHMRERECRQYDVEGRIVEGEAFRVHLLEAEARLGQAGPTRLRPRGRDHPGGDVDADNSSDRDAGAEELEWQQTGAGPDVEDAITGFDAGELQHSASSHRREPIAVLIELLGNVVVARRIQSFPPLDLIRHSPPASQTYA